ncbi:MAG: hypothetical protein P8J78_03555, partial [Maricaulis sp.]|nr:hypothetical protein [Maricaulis sp.]
DNLPLEISPVSPPRSILPGHRKCPPKTSGRLSPAINANVTSRQNPASAGSPDAYFLAGADLTDANLSAATGLVNMNVNESTTFCRTRMFNGELLTSVCRGTSSTGVKQAH